MAAYQCGDVGYMVLQATEVANLLLLPTTLRKEEEKDNSDSTVLDRTGNYFTVLCFRANLQQILIFIFRKFSRQVTISC